jgi:hypothetical protein
MPPSVLGDKALGEMTGIDDIVNKIHNYFSKIIRDNPGF